LFAIPLPQALSNHDLTIGQAIENKKLLDSDSAKKFNRSVILFPTNDEALFITDEHERIAICKDNALK
jgi:hypothetical protein